MASDVTNWEIQGVPIIPRSLYGTKREPGISRTPDIQTAVWAMNQINVYNPHRARSVLLFGTAWLVVCGTPLSARPPARTVPVSRGHGLVRNDACRQRFLTDDMRYWFSLYQVQLRVKGCRVLTVDPDVALRSVAGICRMWAYAALCKYSEGTWLQTRSLDAPWQGSLHGHNLRAATHESCISRKAVP